MVKLSSLYDNVLRRELCLNLGEPNPAEGQLARMAVVSIVLRKHVQVLHGGRPFQHQCHQLSQTDDINDNIKSQQLTTIIIQQDHTCVTNNSIN